MRARTAELRESEAQLRDLFDGTSELVQSTAPDGTILFTNRAWRETLGYDHGEITAMNVFDVIHPDHREACAEFLGRLLAGEDAGAFETVMVAKNGRACDLEGSVTVGFEHGRPTVTRGIFRDITARKAMDRALRESEEQHRLMIQSSRDAILTLHPPDWRFTSCNPAAVELFGAASEAQVCTLEPWKLSPAVQEDGRDSSTRAAELIATAMANGSHAFEWIHQKLTGEPFVAAVLLSRVVQGGQAYLLVTIRDITVQKQAATAMRALNKDLDQLVVERTGQLRESEERFRHLVDSSPNAVLMTASDGIITFANRRVETIFGYQPDELVGRAVEVLLPEMQRGAHVEYRGDAFQHPQARAMGRGRYLFARRKDGTDVAVEIGLTPIEMSGGRFMMATVTDITARKRAEEAVKRLAAFPEVNPNPVMELTGEGVVTYTNAAATDLARGLGLAEAAQMLPLDTPAIVRECLATGHERLRLEQRFGKRVLSWSFYPIAERGVVHGYAADITERLTLEDQLRQSQKMEAIGQLAGGVAHDFNNILSVVMMQAEVSASAEGLSSEALEGLQEIQACAERGADLTRQLLLFSRRQVMQPKNLNLNEVVTTIARMLQRIIGEDVRLELHLHTSRLTTRADAGMLDQVLLNLAVNARDAMPKGGRLRVETWEETVSEEGDRPYPDVLPGRYVGMSVSDTGCGIPADVLPRIFEPFFTTKEAGKGTGLGLATVFGIVRQHGGWVTVASEPGQGTTFRILLPAIAATLEQVNDRAKPAPRGGTETVLVVEDEPSVRTLVRAILQRRGYTVIEAASGVEALKLWDAHRAQVSLLLTDLVMPDGVNGQELARRLRLDMPGLRVVFSSGYSSEIAGRELKLGAGENFLQKPFSADTLSEMVRRALDTPPAAA
ncbi:MAG: PAS domain S-box protein [Acidobacteria bacterium]|nr:PAS domain S-box protein [Acidobacteriota bacterium]